MSLKVLPPAVVVHAGRRDGYQLALALNEGGLLEALVTDAYWDESVYRRASAVLGARLPERYCVGLDPRRVHFSSLSLLAAAASRLGREWNFDRLGDAALGRRAYAIARRRHAAVFSYSYYARQAFRPGPEQPPYRFLFQLHPHHACVRRLLQEEIEMTPQGAASLGRESELRLSGRSLEELVSEPALANGWVVASSYTARTLSQHGVPLDRIHVVPYGVDSNRFTPRDRPPPADGPFRVIFVGSLAQRKGLSYLFEAVRSLKTKHVQLVLRGRGNIDHDLLAHYRDVDIDLKIGLSTEELVRDLHRCDMFALPSIAEGFGQVILEAMACGIPVVTTANTCAPDIMSDGEHGFLVPIRDSAAIAEKISWGLENRGMLADLGILAAERARTFTWDRFRAGVRRAYGSMIHQTGSGNVPWGGWDTKGK